MEWRNAWLLLATAVVAAPGAVGFALSGKAWLFVLSVLMAAVAGWACASFCDRRERGRTKRMGGADG